MHINSVYVYVHEHEHVHGTVPLMLRLISTIFTLSYWGHFFVLHPQKQKQTDVYYFRIPSSLIMERYLSMFTFLRYESSRLL